MKNQTDLSIVVPVFNETAVFPELLRRITAVLDSPRLSSAEIIFVDDGSRDDTLAQIRAASSKDSRIRYLSFSRNFGHQVAVSAGIEHAGGRCVAVIDGDLQDPPELIPELMAKHAEGWEVVYAVRKKRKEGPLKRLAYFLFYRMMDRISDIEIPLDTGDFCLMDRKVVDVLKAMPERNRYVRGIRAWAGFRQTAFPYERDKRQAGEAKYSLAKLIRLAMDGVTSFSDFPLKLCGYIGFFIAGMSVVGLAYTIVSKFFFDTTPQGWTSILIAVLFIGGVQLVMLSVVGHYISRIYAEVRQRPLYVLKESSDRH
jgi:dolichol-phosphate mannosyltransferase